MYSFWKLLDEFPNTTINGFGMKIWMTLFYTSVELSPLNSFWLFFEQLKNGQINLTCDGIGIQ